MSGASCGWPRDVMRAEAAARTLTKRRTRAARRAATFAQIRDRVAAGKPTP